MTLFLDRERGVLPILKKHYMEKSYFVSDVIETEYMVVPLL